MITRWCLALASGLCAALLALSPATLAGRETAQENAPFKVWPTGAPSMAGWPGLAGVPVQEELRENGEQIFNVTEPTLQPFLPDPARATGMAVIVVPGGGFRLIGIHHEGTRVARWLADHGVAAFVLKYRTIQTPPGETGEEMRLRVLATLAPGVGGEPGVQDAFEALRLVRSRAAGWGLDPHRIGIMGFSAGGHVAAMTLFGPDSATRPDFAALIYGMPFGQPEPDIPPANLPLPPGAPGEPWLQPPPVPAPGRLPPMFHAMAQDDLAVGVGYRAFYDRLFAAGYRPELHLYARGGHAFGAKARGTTADHWLDTLRWWLESEVPAGGSLSAQ